MPFIFDLDAITVLSETGGGTGGGGGTTNYNQLTNKPSINGVILLGNKTTIDLGLASSADIVLLNDSLDAIDIDIADLKDNKIQVNTEIDDINDRLDNISSGVTEDFVNSSINNHNLSDQSHNDIRNKIVEKANLPQSDNTKIGTIAIIGENGQYEVSTTKLQDINDDIDILNQETGLLTTSINDIKDDYISKTKDNTITGKNTLNGDIVLGANVRNSINNKVIVTTKTIDANTQSTYVGGDQIEMYAPDSLSIESENVIIKRNNESGIKTNYTNIDSGNVNDVVSTAIATDTTIARTNVGNTFSVRNTFSNGISVTGGGAFGLTMNATPITLMNSSKIQDNGNTTLLMALESQNKTYLGGKNEIWANAPDKIMLQTGSLITKRNNTEYTVIDSGNISNYITSGLSAQTEKYGIQADYSTHYGILDCPNGLITYSINNKEVEIQPNVVLQMAGSDTKTMIASKTTYEIEETGKVILFFTKTTSESGTTQLGFIEAGDVFYQEEEPTNGTTSFLAWWKPSLGLWQFKSNYTGNVWRTAIATPIANINAGTTGITSVNYIGYRIIDDDIFAQLSDIDSINGTISTINENVNGLQSSVDDLFTELEGKQSKLLSRQMLQNTIPTVSDISEDASLSDIISAFNSLLANLRTRGVIN